MATTGRATLSRAPRLGGTAGEEPARTHHLAAAAILGGLTLAWFHVVLLHLRTRRAVDVGDSSVFVWAWQFQPDAVAAGHSPFATRDLFFPVGADLSLSTTAPLIGFLTWPVRALGGSALQINLVQLATTFLAGWFAYRLALRTCGRTGPSVLAGAAFTFAPFRLIHASGHLNLIHIFWIPLSLLALLDLVERPARRTGVLLGACLAGAILTDPQIGLLCLLAMAPVVVHRRSEVRAAPRPAVVAAATAAVLALPVVVPTLLALRRGEADPMHGFAFPEGYSTDLVAWVVPPARHPIWGAAAGRVFEPITLEGLAAPGVVLLGLALFGRRLGPSGRRPWTWMGLVAGVLALGPFLQVLGRSTSGFSPRIFLPFALLGFVPGLSSFRVPGRISIVAVLAVDLLAAGALAAILRRWPRQGLLVFSAVALVTALELLPSRLPTSPAAVPDPYHRIAADGDHRAVLEIPLQWSTGSDLIGDRAAKREDSIFLAYAAVHHRPLVSGSVSRYPARRLARLTSNPLYRQVLTLQDEPGYVDPPTFRGPDLAAAGIGFVVLHRDRPVPRADTYLQGLSLPVLADDGTVLVYRTAITGG